MYADSTNTCLGHRHVFAIDLIVSSLTSAVRNKLIAASSVRGKLIEKARRTEGDPQRKDRIRPISFLWPDQSLGWRLIAEVEDELEAVTAACAARASRPPRGRPMPLQPGHRQAASPQFPARSSSASRRASAVDVPAAAERLR